MSVACTRNTSVLRIFCDICFLTIDFEPVCQCLVCNIDICVHCLYSKLEYNSHKITHEYRVIELTYKNEYNWNILERFIFYNGIDAYGIGNWDIISKSLGTKSKIEIELFFYKEFYITKNTFLIKKVYSCISNPFRSKVSIYMKDRQDFDVEFMNNHEDLVKEIEFIETDEVYEKQAKMAILRGYDVILDIRRYRRELMIQKEIVNIDKQNSIKDNYKEWIDITKYRFLLEYLSVKQFYKFIEGICIEKQLKIEKLKLDFKVNSNESTFCKESNIEVPVFCEFKRWYINNLIKKSDCLYKVEQDKYEKIIDFLDRQKYFG